MSGDAKVVQGAFKPRRFWRNKWVIIAVVVLIVVLAAWIVMARVDHNRAQKRAAKAAQASLQSQLTQAVYDTHSDNDTIQIATSLITGATSRRFSMSASDLAQAYLDRANAYANLGKQTAALVDYQKAITTSDSVKIGALQGELSAQSQLGHTSALVPILQQLIPLLHSSQMPLANSQAAQYQAAINAIQSGQEVSF